MSTNQDLQQINVFSKGMNTDTSDAFLSNELYRYAENLRFITEDGTSNGGELRSIEGWSNFHDLIDKDYGTIDPLQVSSIRNYIIIVGKKGSKWGVWSLDTKNPGRYLTRHFGLCDDDISNNVSIVTRWESDKNIKVYIADGINLLMSLNIANNLYSGNKIKDIVGSLELVLPLLLTTINTNQESRISAPVLQYAYILYKLGSVSTDISPLTKPVVLYKDDSGYYNGEIINSTVTLTLDGVDSSQVDRIKIYRIAYVLNGQEPDISLIYDEAFPNNVEPQFLFIDNGYDILKLTAAEFIAQNNVRFKPLLIESKNDYLFAANIEYDLQEVDDLFKDCTVYYSAHYDRTYTIDDKNTVINPNTGLPILDGSGYIPSFKRGEWYRFGIVFYDKSGRRSSVMCITDFKVPGIDEPQLYQDIFRKGLLGYVISPCYIKAHVDNIPDDCSGYEIVRCKRTIYDTKNLYQGIIGRAYKLDIDPATPDRFAFPYLTMDLYGIYGNKADNSVHNCISCNDTLMFACPEYSYQADDVKLVLGHLKNNIKLKFLYTSDISFTTIDLDVYIYPNPSMDHDGGDVPLERVIILGSGALVGNYREYGEFFTQDNGKYYALPGAGERVPHYHTFDDSSDYISVLEKEGDTVSQQISMCRLYCRSNPVNSGEEEVKIKEVGYTTSPNYNGFNDGEAVLIDNDRTPIGDLSFVNWDAVTFYTKYGYFRYTEYAPAYNDLKISNGGSAYRNFAVTAGSKYILLNGDFPTTLSSNWDTLPLPITIASIVNDNVSPYGGDTDVAKNNSVFYSFGDYVQYSVEHSHAGITDSTLDLMSGDTYISMFTYNSAHCWESAYYRARMYPTVYNVPIESDINLKAAYGDLYNNMTSLYNYRFLDKAGVYGKLVLEKDAYLYNTAYNGAKDLISYTPISYTSISNEKFDCRVHYSQIKTNGEYTDSWLNFKSADFIDVDTRYGLITDLNLFKDTLVFWQDLAAGVLSVNERTMLQDVNDTNIILGNGDVLLRYDYLTTQYGMRPNLKARTQSNNALYWWDGYSKEILLYPGGREVLPLKKVKTVSKYVNSVIEKLHACLAYDPKYAEVLFNIRPDVVSGGGWRYETLVYNEYIQLFTGVYTKGFDFATKTADSLILTKNNNLYEWNEGSEFLKPILKYIINKDSTRTKVYDNIEFGMGESFMYDEFYSDCTDYKQEAWNQPCLLKFDFKTPLDQTSSILKNITKREYDLRLAIPRNNNAEYGDRLRGRTMQCTLTNEKESIGFSLLYIITKYRISYS